jgi:selenocysteine lyase/cysteine desulfurase
MTGEEETLDDIFVRDEFPVTKRYAYLDVANKCAPPARVSRALVQFIEDQSATGGDKEGWLGTVARVKALFARVIGVNENEVALVKNTSEGLNLIANSFAYRPGDNIVISDLEHPNNAFPWVRLRQQGVELRVVPSKGGIITPQDLERYVDDRTRLVSLTAVACVSGARLDLKGMADVCHAHGGYLVVDGVQCLGILELGARPAGVDFLAAGAYKGLLAPHGLAFLYVRQDLITKLTPPVAARANVKVDAKLHKVSSLEMEFRDDAGRFEIGNYNYGAATAGCAALEFLLSLGIENIERRVLYLSGLMVKGIQGIGLEPLGPTGERQRSGIVSVRVADADRVVRGLEQAGIIASPREGAVRFSFHVYNDESDIERAIKVLKQLV